MIHDVLILGAGLSGLKAARDLHAADRSVLVLDKGRGVSGRASTRRWDDVPVDHGAQFFTARSEAFRAQVADWIARVPGLPIAVAIGRLDRPRRVLRVGARLPPVGREIRPHVP